MGVGGAFKQMISGNHTDMHACAVLGLLRHVVLQIG
jgi:hypothetical protein